MRELITVTKLDYHGQPYEARVEQEPPRKSHGQLWAEFRERFNAAQPPCRTHINWEAVERQQQIEEIDYKH